MRRDAEKLESPEDVLTVQRTVCFQARSSSLWSLGLASCEPWSELTRVALLLGTTTNTRWNLLLSVLALPGVFLGAELVK